MNGVIIGLGGTRINIVLSFDEDDDDNVAMDFNTDEESSGEDTYIPRQPINRII